ncbi:1-acyl-sn-glycerol-3-phosphate acyltransferase [Teredinibacter purpureus]|uniref:1-acyl-sn-glycerol-3-phosphate acyltransferase n=1 Tax=Teredinibacter purpureus TaxID=2731756 RepID=UPI0005F83FD5|nr:1-acyl-sn-glycerol-3-phosphate acyltransferase [Teredinibacter purpureus]
MSEFEDIRPYNDDEVRPIIERLLADGEFLDTLAKFKLPSAMGFAARALRSVVRKRLAKEVGHINNVESFQALIEKYLSRSINETVKSLTYSGLEHINANEPYLFISNHRDIAMDPALINWVLFHNNYPTMRIAIGDNLLTKPFAADLMRLNKSFIVRRNLASRREKLAAAKKLASYIHHSVLTDRENLWIAQREGRAKDGWDKTNPALINMFAMSKPSDMPFEDFIREARIVPVSISYAYDPCDIDKAHELHQKAVHGSYTKDEHEDVMSIARGITGYKEAVHVSFGTLLEDGLETADDVAEEIDRQVESNYILHSTNCFAYELLEHKTPSVRVGAEGIAFETYDWGKARAQFKDRIATCNDSTRKIVLTGYANPVYRRLGEQKC